MGNSSFTPKSGAPKFSSRPTKIARGDADLGKLTKNLAKKSEQKQRAADVRRKNENESRKSQLRDAKAAKKRSDDDQAAQTRITKRVEKRVAKISKKSEKRQASIRDRQETANALMTSGQLLHRWLRAQYNPVYTIFYVASVFYILQFRSWALVVVVVLWAFFVLLLLLFQSDLAMCRIRNLDESNAGLTIMTLGLWGVLAQHLTHDGSRDGGPRHVNPIQLIRDLYSKDRRRTLAEIAAAEAAEVARRQADDAHKKAEAARRDAELAERELQLKIADQQRAEAERHQALAKALANRQLPQLRIQQLNLPIPRIPSNPTDFEYIARDWLEAWGDTNVYVTVQSGDAGIDVVSDHCVAQVKFYSGKFVGRPEIQSLKGAAHTTGGHPLFFAYCNGYTQEAIRWADLAEVCLFTFNAHSLTFDPTNGHAVGLVEALAAYHFESVTGTVAAGVFNADSAEKIHHSLATGLFDDSVNVWDDDESDSDLFDDDFEQDFESDGGDSDSDSEFEMCESCGGVGELFGPLGGHRQTCGFCSGSGLQLRT